MRITQNIKLAFMAAAIFLMAFLGIFLLFKISVYLAPFIIAFIISTFIEPIIRILMKKTKASRKMSAIITVFSVITVVAVILILLIIRLYKEAVSLSQILPEYANILYGNINKFIEKFLIFYTVLPEEIAISVKNVLENFVETFTFFLNSIVKGILGVAVMLPQAFIFLSATILSTYFFSSDRTQIYNFVRRNLPKGCMDILLKIKKDIFMTLWGYVRAQIILMIITFLQLLAGFLIMGIKHSVLLASILSLLDVLPILGPGSVMIPWAIYEFFVGNLKRSVIVLVLYGIVSTVRQVMEPKVLSKEIGLHPLVALMSLYIGFLVFGYLGLIAGPLVVLLFKNVVLKKKSIKEFIAQAKL